ncbi:MAG: hypothetical protein AAF196_07795 [Planctomycetota bacterium]
MSVERVSRLVAAMPDVRPNGSTGFVLEIGDDVWMEIDLEAVSDEGDSIEIPRGETPSKINCISFHVPYGQIEGLNPCVEVALEIADGLEWQLYDEQTGDSVVRSPARKPRWRFW